MFNTYMEIVNVHFGDNCILYSKMFFQKVLNGDDWKRLWFFVDYIFQWKQTTKIQGILHIGEKECYQLHGKANANNLYVEALKWWSRIINFLLVQMYIHMGFKTKLPQYERNFIWKCCENFWDAPQDITYDSKILIRCRFCFPPLFSVDIAENLLKVIINTNNPNPTIFYSILL